MISGKIRDGEAFNRDLSIYEEWLSRGWIDSIIFSGWREDRHDGCISRLEAIGAQIVLTDPPNFRSLGNIFHQMKSMYYGLRHLPDDTVVLKSRTDKVWLNFDPQEALTRFRDAAPTGPLSPFSRRVHVLAMLPLQPFFINDMMLMGLAGDIRKMLSFDIWFELEQAILNAEQVLHYYPHSRGDDIWRAFYRINPGLIHADENMSRRLIRILLKNDIFLRAVGEYLLAFEDGYSIGIGGADDFVQPAQSSVDALLDLPASESWDGIRFAGSPNTLEITNNDAVTHLLDLPISSAELRSFRMIAQAEPLPGAAIQIWSELLAGEFLDAFPDYHSRPVVAQRQGAFEIVPSRIRHLFPNDL